MSRRIIDDQDPIKQDLDDQFADLVEEYEDYLPQILEYAPSLAERPIDLAGLTNEERIRYANLAVAYAEFHGRNLVAVRLAMAEFGPQVKHLRVVKRRN